MDTYTAHLDKLFSEGVIDKRKMAVFSTAKGLPNGEFGLCLICLNGNLLNVYDTTSKWELKELMYSIELSKITQFKASSFVFNRYIKFCYQNFRYTFADFGNAKNFIAAIEDELKN